MNVPSIYSIDNSDKKRAQNQIFFFLWAKKNCPLNFTERIAWSLLVKAERRKGQGTSQAEIAELSGLSRVTVRKALKTDSLLRANGLVVRVNHRSWRAVEPLGETASWFSTRRTKGEHWADRVAYWPVDLSVTNPELLFDRVLLGLLRTLKGNKPAAYQECYESLAVALGCDYRRIKAALTRLQECQPIEIINTMKNRFGRVVRFDVLFDGEGQAIRLAEPVVEKEQQVVETSECAQAEQTEKVMSQPTIERSLPNSTTDDLTPIEKRFAAIRGLESEMRKLMEAKGHEQWRIGQILGAACKVPMDDRRRVFHAIVNKHGKSPETVLTEIRNNVDYRKRRERSEANELFALEAMSQFVTA